MFPIFLQERPANTFLDIDPNIRTIDQRHVTCRRCASTAADASPNLREAKYRNRWLVWRSALIGGAIPLQGSTAFVLAQRCHPYERLSLCFCLGRLRNLEAKKEIQRTL